MVQQDHETILADTRRVSGRRALRDNVAGAIALAHTVRSTLGPKGLDKLLDDGKGSTLVTNDGVTILETAEIHHEGAKLLVASSRAQDDQVRDGTSSTIVIIAELLSHALDLVDRGVHPAVIAAGYRLCGPEIEAAIEEIAMPADEAGARAAVRTALSGKGDAGMRAVLAELAHDAARAAGSGDPAHVRVIQQRKGAIGDSERIQGLVVEKQRVHREMALKPDGGRILILDGGLEKRAPEIDATLRITDTGALAAFHARDRADLQARVDALVAADIDCLIARDGIEEEAHPMLAEAGILAYRRVERPEIEHLCRATGARPVLDVKDICEEDVGTFDAIREEKHLGTNHLILEGSETTGVTVVLRGSSDLRLAESEHAFDDALGVASQLVLDERVLPGGGATHIALARRLRRFAETIPGREQMAIEAFAAALEVIPRALAENAGLDPIDELLRATAAQTEADEAWLGLDIDSGQVAHMAEVAVVEPIRVTGHALAGAIEAAISILRIDDLVWAKQEAEEPDWKTED